MPSFRPAEGKCTGFEMGFYRRLGSDAFISLAALETTIVHSGSYALRVPSTFATDGYWGIDFPAETEFYLSVWCFPNGADALEYTGLGKIRIILLDAHTLELVLNDGHWDAYMGGNKIADGTRSIVNDWHRVEIHISLAGVFQTRINGVDDINYNGPTTYGTNPQLGIDWICLYTDARNPTRSIYWDDFTLGYDNWADDIRYDPVLVPIADVAPQEWSLSTGSAAYALVDAVPTVSGSASGSYIYSGSSGSKVRFEFSNWDGSGKVPEFVTVWAYANKNDAVAHKLNFLAYDGSGSSGSAKNLQNSDFFAAYTMTTAPSGSAWSNTAIDDLQIALESGII